MSLDQQELIDANNIIYFDSFGVEHIPQEIKKIIRNKSIIANNLQNTSTRYDNVWILLYWIY